VKFIKEKRELLIVKLLINKVKASDILPDTFTIITRYINFPFIITENVYKVIIKVNNITLNVNEVLTTILQVTWPQINTRVMSLF
jgi:hypothetical protein